MAAQLYKAFLTETSGLLFLHPEGVLLVLTDLDGDQIMTSAFQ